MEKIKASVLLLTQNNENCIRRCLDSLVAFEQVVMVDGGSRDLTMKIAGEYSNVKIVEHPWKGFVEQRNFSIKCADYKWCFMIDSDEAATPLLIQEIRKKISDSHKTSSEKKMYRIMRTEFYLGKELSFGFGRNSWQERLFLRDHIQYTGGVHHQHLIDGVHQSEKENEIGYFDSEARILHDENYGLKDWIIKLPRFAVLRAEEKIAVGRRVTGPEVLFEFPVCFFKIWLQSWRHGPIGFIIATQTAIFRTLVKLIIYEKTKIAFDSRQKKLRELG